MRTQSPEPGPAAPRVRLPFASKLVALIAAACALTALAAIIAVSQTTRETARSLSLDQWRLIHDEVRGSIAHQSRGAEALLRQVADALVSSRAPDDRVDAALALVEASGVVDHVGIYDRAGGLIDSIQRGDGQRPPLPRVLSVPAERAADWLAVVPIRAGTEITGYAAARISLTAIGDRLRELDAHYLGGRGTGIVVLTSSGQPLFPPELSIDEAAGLRSRLGWPEPAADAEAPLTSAHATSVVEYVGADGEAMLAYARELERPAGAVIVRVPTAQVDAPVARAMTALAGSLALAALLAGLLAAWLATRISRPVRALTTHAEELGRRNFDQRNAVATRDELSVLGYALNTASQQLADSEAQLAREATIRESLGRYLAPELVEDVVADKLDLGLGGQRCEVSVLFADVVAFTPFSESHDPETVVGLLNDLFAILTEIVFKNGGTVDKFMGDCVMALFGAPRSQPDHAARALETAVDMMRWMAAGAQVLEQRYGARIDIAIGVGTGVAIVGNVGTERRMQYTAVGDIVNISARLEVMARPGQILATTSSATQAGSRVSVVDLGSLDVPGREEPVPVCEVKW